MLTPLESDHPTLKQLRAFANGSAESEQDTWIEEHVFVCEVCARALEDAPADGLVALLQRQADVEQSQRVPASPSISNSNEVGRTAASFEIRKQLGRGGMGVVYLAWQPALNRHIALKMIARGELANPEDLIRFRREAAAAAALRHENIVQVYDVGEQDGKPYIAMELVNGCTLSQLLTQGPLPVTSAIPLFIQLAAAVQHAHAHSVVHRDLKPSNILLNGCDPSGIQSHSKSGSNLDLHPKVVDFGLAKRVDQVESSTLTGDLIGTPSYMSPEQAKGDTQAIGVCTDIYSLGAIFYEVLLGRPPFQGASPLETLEQVLSQDPVRPRSLRPGLPRDLETICLKCLEKTPSRRYQQASELLDDLKRFQAGRPIAARPTGWFLQIVKWTRRRPALAALVGTIAICFVGVLAISILHNRSMSKALDATRTEKLRADTNFRFAIQSIEQMLERVGFEQLSDRPEMEEVRAELLTDAVKFYSDLLKTQPESDVESRRLYIRALSRKGHILWLLGKNDVGRASLQQAIDLQKQLKSEMPGDPVAQYELAVIYINHGMIDQDAASIRTAVELLEEIRESYPLCRRELAQARSNLATVTARTEEAESHHLDALALRQQLLKENPDDPKLQSGVGQSQSNLGFLYFRSGRLEIASEAFENAIGIFEGLVERHGTVTDYQSSLAESYTSLASLRHQIGQYSSSIELIEKSTDRRRLLVARFPKIPAIQKRLAQSYLTHATFLIQRDRFTEAVSLSEKALEIAEHLNQELPLRQHQLFVAASLTILATAASGVPDTIVASAAFEKATGLYDSLLVESPDDVDFRAEAGVNSMNFSNVLRPEDPMRALEYNDRSVGLLEKIWKDDPKRQDFQSYLFNARGARAQTLETLKRYPEAATAWAEAVELSPVESRVQLQLFQALAMVRAGDLTNSASLGRQIATNEELGGADLYNLACLFGLLDQQDSDSKPVGSQEVLGDSPNGAIAIELLGRPASREFLQDASNRNQLASDPDLATVRSRPGFQVLWSSL